MEKGEKGTGGKTAESKDVARGGEGSSGSVHAPLLLLESGAWAGPAP